ncbi:YopT-type cysteine protease domain-containing protein [Bradyrhizobium glycinis]|uniref:YopT-type cysteine protease domain-containing protein n=1 Tax=Bradyrhizobium glycinis TaxID=2751812 RepID=UPI0018D7FF22|nr:YopT-type cysteine protease domain-containing protein [Bradyrhizobium glycinis]MBH5370594.1 YopT-type cysteine protease domain-containing protein [Bradyrhizobium glycinis]
MDNRISNPSQYSSLGYEPSQSGDSDGFAETLANLALRRSPSVLDRMGCCVSTPHTSDPDNPGASSAARPSRPLFEYRTGELEQANVDGICLGLTGEWLGNLRYSPRSRINALRPGSQGHSDAADRQQQYADLRADLRSEGVKSATLQAINAVLREIGLNPAGKEKEYRFDDPTSISRMFEKITADGSRHILSLRFAEGGRHSVATAASDGTTTLFDPNYGEFNVRSGEIDELFYSLADRYRDPNRLHLSTISTQKIR